MKSDLNLYGRLQAAIDVLAKTPQKWLNSKGELSILKACQVNEKCDPRQRLQQPSPAAMQSFSEERLEVLLMFLDQF